MRDLVELASFINTSKNQPDTAWDLLLAPNSKLRQLYDLAIEKPDIQEEDAARELYGTDAKKAGVNFQALKNRLKDRLTDGLFLFDTRTGGLSNRQRAYAECNKKWAAAMILLAKNQKNLVIRQLESLLRTTQHFEFTEITVNILNTLRLHFGAVTGDLKKYEYYRGLYKRYQSEWLMENEAEDLYAQLISGCINTRSTTDHMSVKAKEYFAQISPMLAQSSSFRLHLSGRLIELQIHNSRNDYAAIVRLCEDAIQFFEAKPYESTLPLQVFYYQLLMCCVQLGDFERGQEIIGRYEQLFEVASFNWFKLQELAFLLAMHTGHYDEAWNVYERVYQQPRLAKQPASIREMWKIFEAYVYFLAYSGQFRFNAGERFKLPRFLNEVPVFSKDKRGMNIPVLIVQILFALRDRNHGQLLDRIEAIEKYCTRYLRQDETYRSSCFIKMLLQIPAGHFHKEAVRRKGEKLLAQLQKRSLHVAGQMHEIEIIPYEDLWEIALQQLNTRVVRPRSRQQPVQSDNLWAQQNFVSMA